MNKMPRRWNGFTIAIMALTCIGLVYVFILDPIGFIIPILVLGGIFLLYKYPPSFLRGACSNTSRTQVKQSRSTVAKSRAKKPRSKTSPFRVIEGGKDDDDLPKYH